MAADPRFLHLLDVMREVHIKKNAGYSGKDNPDKYANFREAENFGVSAFLGGIVRTSDKWVRLRNLVKDPTNEMVGENIEKTLMDLAIYALILICLKEEETGKVLSDEELL